MVLRNIFKKKKTEEPKKVERIKELPKEEMIKPEVPVRRARFSGEAYRVLKPPHITEKATDLAKKNQYVFKISETANKTEIKKAIENLYGVNVLAVRIIKIPKKLRRLGRQRGWKKGYKKAIVKIKEGQKIEVLPR